MTDVLAPLVNFGVLVAILWWVGRKPFSQMLQSRAETVAKTLKEAEQESNEATVLLRQWQMNHSGMQAHAEKNMAEAKAMVERFREQTLSFAKKEAARISKEAEFAGTNESARIKKQLGTEVIEGSLKLASQHLEAHLDEKDRKKLLSDYLDLVGNGHAD